MAAAVLTGCKVDSDSCPKIAQVPFECVELPDSVKAGEEFIVDVKLYDYGCYTEAKAAGVIVSDTVYLEAYVYYDECDCPKQSANLNISYRSRSDTSLHNVTMHYVYMLVNETKDSVMICCEPVKFY